MAQEKILALTFAGGAGTATGANFLLDSTVPGAEKILVDCGLFQGPKVADDQNREPFPYVPAGVDLLFITHAHLDHIGRIPKLWREGFRGRIFSTAPTKEMAALSLLDSLGVLEKEARQNGQPPFYDEKDVAGLLAKWETLEYGQNLNFGALEITARDAGHILGSAMYEFVLDGKKLVFTGDLGNSPAPLLRNTEWIKDANYLVIESVYGDRNHEDRSRRKEKLEDIIESTMHGDGTLIIPAFSIERTQEMLYEIEQMMEQSRIPLVPVYIDSPLAIKITKIYKKYAKTFLKDEVTPAILGVGGIFAFPQLKQTLTTEESRAIAAETGRKIIIAGSGMSNGGRVIHHEKRYLSDPKNALLLVGYQAAGSLGRQLQEGARQVTILGERIPVRARILTISGYSAHKDSTNLLEFVRHSADTLKKVFVALGEPKSSLFLAQKIRDYLALDARVPEPGERVVLDW